MRGSGSWPRPLKVVVAEEDRGPVDGEGLGGRGVSFRDVIDPLLPSFHFALAEKEEFKF